MKARRPAGSRLRKGENPRGSGPPSREEQVATLTLRAKQRNVAHGPKRPHPDEEELSSASRKPDLHVRPDQGDAAAVRRGDRLVPIVIYIHPSGLAPALPNELSPQKPPPLFHPPPPPPPI